MELPIAEGHAISSMFYAITGTFMVLVIIGVGFSAVTAFRYLGGRTDRPRDRVGARPVLVLPQRVFFALWFVVYVTK